jgi:hypothetical protein
VGQYLRQMHKSEGGWIPPSGKYARKNNLEYMCSGVMKNSDEDQPARMVNRTNNRR